LELDGANKSGTMRCAAGGPVVAESRCSAYLRNLPYVVVEDYRWTRRQVALEGLVSGERGKGSARFATLCECQCPVQGPAPHCSSHSIVLAHNVRCKKACQRAYPLPCFGIGHGKEDGRHFDLESLVRNTVSCFVAAAQGQLTDGQI